MRRGLISRSLVELPDAVLDARLARVRTAMTEAQFDALLIYTNNTRPAAVSWLTGFVPYWSDALLVVPREGALTLAAALSVRVKSWIERVSRLGEVLHSPRIGLTAAQQIVARQENAAVGVVEFGGLPTGVADDLREYGPKLRLSDASELFATARARADPAALALAAKAAAIAQRALAQAQGGNLNAMIAHVERTARLLGAEEIYVAAAPDLARETRFIRVEGERPLGKSFALRASVAYKGAWVRVVRTMCEQSIARQATERLAQAVAQLPSDRGFAGFGSWLIEGCRIAQPLEPLMGSRIGAAKRPPLGAIVCVQGTLAIEGNAVAVGAPALIGQAGDAASLLVGPVYE